VAEASELSALGNMSLSLLTKVALIFLTVGGLGGVTLSVLLITGCSQRQSSESGAGVSVRNRVTATTPLVYRVVFTLQPSQVFIYKFASLTWPKQDGSYTCTVEETDPPKPRVISIRYEEVGTTRFPDGDIAHFRRQERYHYDKESGEILSIQREGKLIDQANDPDGLTYEAAYAPCLAPWMLALDESFHWERLIETTIGEEVMRARVVYKSIGREQIASREAYRVSIRAYIVNGRPEVLDHEVSLWVDMAVRIPLLQEIRKEGQLVYRSRLVSGLTLQWDEHRSN